MTRKKRMTCGQPRIRWWNLNKENMPKLLARVSFQSAWEKNEDTNMWSKAADTIRDAEWEVLGVSNGGSRDRRC